MRTNVLSKFSSKVLGMINRKSKDLILSAAEAGELNVAITELLEDRVALLEQIKQLQDEAGKVIEVRVGGGAF